MTAKPKPAATRKETMEWLMREDTEVGLRACIPTDWKWRADAPNTGMFWAESKFEAIRKAILAERKAKRGKK